MKTERSSDELKILDLFKNDNFKLGVQLCEALGLDVVDLLVMILEDLEATDYIVIENMYISKTSYIHVWWRWDWKEPLLENHSYKHTEYKDYKIYRELAIILFAVYNEQNQ